MILVIIFQKNDVLEGFPFYLVKVPILTLAYLNYMSNLSERPPFVFYMLQKNNGADLPGAKMILVIIFQKNYVLEGFPFYLVKVPILTLAYLNYMSNLSERPPFVFYMLQKNNGADLPGAKMILVIIFQKNFTLWIIILHTLIDFFKG